MSRCQDRELRRQAAGLLTGLSRSSSSRRVPVRKPFGTSTDLSSGQKDTDQWDVEQWIDFAMKTRLDAGMATYFGQLPSEYIEKPVYHPSSA